MNGYWTIGKITEICFSKENIFIKIKSLQEMSVKINDIWYNVFIQKNNTKNNCFDVKLVKNSEKILIEYFQEVIKNAFDNNIKVKIFVDINSNSDDENQNSTSCLKLKKICLIGENYEY